MKKTDIVAPYGLSSVFANDVFSTTSTNDFEIPIPTQTDPNDTCVQDDGFLPITSTDLDLGGIAPERKNFNGLFYLATDQRQYLQNGGLIGFDQDVSDAIGGYPQGAVLKYMNSNGNVITVESLVDDNTESDLTDTTKWRDISSLNRTQITNCVLEAPNGVCSASGLVATIYEGLKVLMPNGRNADGTMKNIEYTVPTTFTFTQTTGVAGGIYCIDNNSNLYGCHYAGYSEGLEADKPTSTWKSGANMIYYATDTNKTYFSSGVDNPNTPVYVEKPLARIAKVYCIYSSGVLHLEPYKPVNILKTSDVADVTHYSFPSHKYLDYTLQTTGTDYESPADGWWVFSKVTGAANANITLRNMATEFGATATNSATNFVLFVNIPVSKGDKVRASYNATGTLNVFRFVYANGEAL